MKKLRSDAAERLNSLVEECENDSGQKDPGTMLLFRRIAKAIRWAAFEEETGGENLEMSGKSSKGNHGGVLE